MKKIILCLAMAAGFCFNVQAQTYPTKPIRLIVPFAPGGGNDTVARAIAQQLTTSLGQSVVVDNKAGAGGIIGADLAAKAPADGYTLFLGGVGSLAVNPHLIAKIPYDPFKDFAPIILLASAPSVVAVNMQQPFKTIQELTAYAKANPNRLNYASNGNGSSAHVATVLYETMAGVEMEHIPYKGLAPAMMDLTSGQVQLMFSSMVAIVPQITVGKFRPLAVTSAKRSSLLPNVPTLAESGLPGYEAGSWYGLLAPAGTPVEIVRKINQEAAKALRQTAVRDSLNGEGAEIEGGSPEDFARHIRVEHGRIGKMLADGRLKMN